MNVTIFTPTGDRPASLMRQKRYIQRSIIPKTWNVNWLVVDDGVVPFNPGDCEYRRREPDGNSSLERQVKFVGNLDTDYVLIWEDDDWCSPHRIRNQIKLLHKSQKHLHGYSCGVYYHIPSQGYRKMQNGDHASFCETAMTAVLWNRFVEIYLSTVGKKVFLDLELWGVFRQYGVLTPNEPRVSLGLKGLPGRNGLGGGHTPEFAYEKDPNLTYLLSVMSKKDADEILLQSTQNKA